MLRLYHRRPFLEFGSFLVRGLPPLLGQTRRDTELTRSLEHTRFHGPRLVAEAVPDWWFSGEEPVPYPYLWFDQSLFGLVSQHFPSTVVGSDYQRHKPVTLGYSPRLLV